MSINLVNHIGFFKGSEELPSFDMFNSIQKRRALFLRFFNTQVNKEARFTKVEIENYKNMNLKDIFTNKIKTLLDVGFTPSQSLFEFNLNKQMTITINSFKNHTGIDKSIVSPKIDRFIENQNSTDNIKVAFNIINMCFNGVEFTISFDANELFSKFVYDKIKRKNQDKITSKCDNCIDIISSTNTTTKVFTYWEFLNKQNLDINHAVNKAVDTIKTTNFNQIYLVYPKHEMFDRHIQIKSKELETCRKDYDIKVIPYSLRSMLR